MSEKELYSTTEVAKILNISRIAIFKKIKSGEMSAQRVGRNYVVPKETVIEMLGKAVGNHGKGEIEKAVAKALNEYGDVFKKLGKE